VLVHDDPPARPGAAHGEPRGACEIRARIDAPQPDDLGTRSQLDAVVAVQVGEDLSHLDPEGALEREAATQRPSRDVEQSWASAGREHERPVGQSCAVVQDDVTGAAVHGRRGSPEKQVDLAARTPRRLVDEQGLTVGRAASRRRSATGACSTINDADSHPVSACGT